jgi:hypothetical protein
MKAAAETDAARRKRGMTEAIVGSAFLRIHEDIVGFAELFEFFLGMRVVRVFVRMKLDSELAISSFDVFFRGVSP